MYARRVVPILLIAGAVMMIMRHRYERGGPGEGGEKHGPISPRGEWDKRVPPLFEKWHAHAHEQEAHSAAI
jgi:hypothetical protein